MRHTPCGCCPPAAPQAWDSSLDSPEVLFLQRHCNCVSDGILFSVLPEKSMQKRGAGNEIALTREKQVVTFYVLSSQRRSRNALRATVESGFLIARYAVRIVT